MSKLTERMEANAKTLKEATAERNKLILEGHQANMSALDIAEHLGVSRAQVYKLLHAQGAKMRSYEKTGKYAKQTE